MPPKGKLEMSLADDSMTMVDLMQKLRDGCSPQTTARWMNRENDPKDGHSDKVAVSERLRK